MMNDIFAGFVQLEATLKGALLTKTSAGTPTEATALPTFRVYGPNGVIANSSGTCSFLDSGTITGVADNGSGACRVTSAGHGLTTGARVTISGVSGATGVNGTHVVTVISSSTFDLDGSTFGGAYVSGGTWRVTGLYRYSIAALGADGYEAGLPYQVLFTFAISGTNYGDLHTFQVG